MIAENAGNFIHDHDIMTIITAFYVILLKKIYYAKSEEALE
jgi:hypothetical protein